MHPILSRPVRVAFYAAAWLPLGAIVATILVGRGLGREEAAVLAFPLSLLFGLLCLPVWFVCAANPLRGSFALGAILAHTIASLLYASVWRFLFGVTARMLEEEGPRWSGVAGRLGPQAPTIFLLGVLFYVLVAAFFYLLAAIEASRRSERREGELRLLAGSAELRALRSQLNPHFLFNSLNSISALTTSDPAAARLMCVRLADFLRRTLGLGERTSVPLAEEVALLELYLAIEQVRLGERLGVRERVDPAARGCLVPPLLLQPLVENAVLHGVATLAEGGNITLEVERRGDRVRVMVENPFDPAAPRRGGGGLGLDNVRRRLEAHAGRDGRLSVEAKDGRFCVLLSLPAVEGDTG